MYRKSTNACTTTTEICGSYPNASLNQMYSLSAIKSGLRQPRRIFGEINRLINSGVNYRSTPICNKSGVNFLDADWDNLIILDACRYDTFADIADLPGEFQHRESLASATDEFLQSNFAGRNLTDTVYVTANPSLYRLQEDDAINVTFYNQIDIWQDNWHEDHHTVMPEPVTEAALRAAGKYPEKRLIIHYIQPHVPYVGPTGVAELPTEYMNIWRAVREGKVDVPLETARTAYRENLELVLPDVATLLAEFTGRTVVTADHGELLGERDSPIPIRRFGHPSHTNIEALVKVPWLVHDDGDRRQVVSEDSDDTERAAADEAVVERRLAELGYAES